MTKHTIIIELTEEESKKITKETMERVSLKAIKKELSMERSEQVIEDMARAKAMGIDRSHTFRRGSICKTCGKEAYLRAMCLDHYIQWRKDEGLSL